MIVSSEYLQCACTNANDYPVSTHFFVPSTLYKQGNMVIIELHKPNVAHMTP